MLVDHDSFLNDEEFKVIMEFATANKTWLFNNNKNIRTKTPTSTRKIDNKGSTMGDFPIKPTTFTHKAIIFFFRKTPTKQVSILIH